MFRTYRDMSFMIKIQRYFIEIRWKIAIEIISSTILDIKFFTSFQIVYHFKRGNRREEDKQGGK